VKPRLVGHVRHSVVGGRLGRVWRRIGGGGVKR
jgi:hypothetical protein